MAALGLAAACGDGTDSGPTPVPSPTPTATATPRPDPTLPPPDERGDEDVALVVVAGDRHYRPTVADLRALPATEAGGVSGVSLAELARQVGVSGDSVVTVEGRSGDLSQIRFWRGSLAEAGESLVVELLDDGLTRLAGSYLPADAWLYALESVAFE